MKSGSRNSALVICNGAPPSRSLARKLASKVNLSVAADGGANVARTWRIRPDVIIGDFDSLKPSTRKFFASSTIIHVARQDNTDLEKALVYLLLKRIRRAIIIGATGGRIDFTLGNLSVLWKYSPDIDLTFVGDGWKAMPVQSGKWIHAKVGTTVSLIPFGPCSGITLKGLHYPLVNGTMKIGEIGVSNVVSRSPFSVTVRKGKMLLFIMEKLA
jgi:thiamine pyrophosphokinase